VVTAGSLWWSVTFTPASPVWAYFGAPTRAWELGAGALVAMGAVGLARMPAASAALLRCAGLAAIALSAGWYGETTPFPGYHAVLPVAGAMAVIAAGCAAPGWLLALGTLQGIGARSYSWYLWHWPVLLIGPYALAQQFGLREKLLAMAFAYFLAVLTFTIVEQPLRDHPTLRAEPGRAVMTGVSLTAAAVAVALVLPALPPRVPLGIGNVASVTLAGEGSTRMLALAKQLDTASRVRRLPANLTPALTKASADLPWIYRNQCAVSFSGTTTPAHCERLGDATSHKLVVLFGDSHAAQWYPALEIVAKKKHWRIAVFSKLACTAADVKIYLDSAKRAYDECVAWRTTALARIRVLHPALVITSSNADGGDPLGVGGSADDAWAKGWATSTKRLKAPGTKVVYINDTPWPKGNVPECLAGHPGDMRSCAQPTKIAVGSARRPMMANAAAEAGAKVVDPMPWFCTLSICPPVVGNTLVYIDDSHVSTPYSKFLAPLLAEQLG
jgi:hypothetical protein